jgi:hypothetical protein
MPTEAELAELQREWEQEGHSAEEIGQRLASMLQREETEPEVETPEEEESESERSQAVLPADDWPICPVCLGNGHVPPELRASRKHEVCPDCHGLGLVRTGSLLPDYATIQCDSCMGNGYVNKPPPEGERVGALGAEYERRW